MNLVLSKMFLLHVEVELGGEPLDVIRWIGTPFHIDRHLPAAETASRRQDTTGRIVGERQFRNSGHRGESMGRGMSIM